MMKSPRGILARRPGTEVTIAGSGPLLPEVKAAAERLGITGLVNFAGHVERIQALLSQTKVFILTSRSEEALIALAEAMIAGVVPVVVDVGVLGGIGTKRRHGLAGPGGEF